MNAQELIRILNRGASEPLSAIRCITKLQPSGGPGEKAFPPTYANAEYAFEERLINGQKVTTALLDSVQSQANRFEEALLEAYQSGRLPLPVFEMEVPGHDVITSLTVPHRVHDAILRDSMWKGMPFRESPDGQRLVTARVWNATPFYEFAPTVLLFGTWDSQSGGGVNTAKVPRCLVSEIIALNAVRGRRTSSRIDPLGIKLVQGVVMKTDDNDIWRFIEPAADAKKPKKAEKPEGKLVRPSEINHGNVAPSITDAETGAGGVTFSEAIQTTVLSLTQLRRLRFPVDGRESAERNVAGRAVIAALGLYAVTLSQESGYQLRSRCHLIPLKASHFELLGRTQNEIDPFDLDSETAGAALQQALKAAEDQGLRWHSGRIELKPRPDLVKLVELSDRTMAAVQGE